MDSITAKFRELRTFQGHTDRVLCTTFSPNDRLVASGSTDKSVRIWNIKEEQEIRRFDHADKVSSIAFSTDGLTLYSGDERGIVHVWDVETGNELKQFAAHSRSVHSIAVPEQRHSLLTGSFGEAMYLWDVETGQEVRRFKKDLVKSHSFSRIVVSLDGQKCLCDLEIIDHVLDFERDESYEYTYNEPAAWNLATGQEINYIDFIQDSLRGILIKSGRWNTPQYIPLLSIDFTPDGRLVLTYNSEDKTIYLWNVETQQLLCPFKTRSQNIYGVLARFLGEGRRIFILDEGNITIYDTVGRAPLFFFDIPDRFTAMAMTFSRDGRYCLASDRDHMIRLWLLPA